MTIKQRWKALQEIHPLVDGDDTDVSLSATSDFWVEQQVGKVQYIQ